MLLCLFETVVHGFLLSKIFLYAVQEARQWTAIQDANALHKDSPGLRCTPFLRQLKPKIALVFIKHLVFMLLPGTCYNIPPV